MSHLDRRQFLTALSAATAGLGGFRWTMANEATPTEHEHEEHDHEEHGHEDGHAEGSDVFLLVADKETKAITVYNTADHAVLGTIEGVVLNGHAGFLPLPDGSVLAVDAENERLVQIGVHGDHAEIVHEASVPGHVAHIAVESDHAHYCAVGTSKDDAHQLHIVNLEDWSVTSLELADAGEVGLIMTHDHLFHRNNTLNQLESYEISALLNGKVEMLSSVPIGTSGHGEAVSEATGELFVASDDGVDVLYTEEGVLTYGKTLAWPEGAGRGYFGRLINEGRHFYTYTADRSAPETEWNTWKNRSIVFDVASGEGIVTELPDGYLMRYALGDMKAFYAVIGGDGDAGVTVDLDPDSESFGQIIATTSLEPMSGGAKPGDAFYELGAYRSTAILPNASQAFVTQGGDSAIVVIDPAAGEVLETIEHTSALTGGGTLAVFGPGVAFTDSIGR